MTARLTRRATLGVALALLLGGAAPPPAFTPLSVDRIAELAALLPEAPAGYGPACADRAAWTQPAIKSRLGDATKAADALLKQSFPAWSDEAYLDYSVTGARGRGERMMNDRKAWLMPLTLAECVEAQGRYLPALEQAMRAIASQPSWVWPAHDYGLRNFRDRSFEVDLFAADSAHDLAQILFMLGDRLSPETKAEVAAALEARVFAPIRQTLTRGGKAHWWLQAKHNWNAVCLKGVTGAALATLPDRRDRALFVAGAEKFIGNYVAGFPADGYSVEGPSYWNYGFSHFTALRELLVGATQEKLDLFADPRIRPIALYAYRIEMAPDVIAAFGDAPRTTRIDGLTRAYVNAAFGLGMPHRLADLPIRARERANAAAVVDAVMTLFAEPLPAPEAGGARFGLASYFDAVGVLISRAAPGGRLGVSIKAGGNGNHSHNDIGSYSIALGVAQPTGDPGMTVYSSKTFSSQRYTIKAINSYGHPVPLVAGIMQSLATSVTPKVLATQLDDSASGMTIDMAPAYPVAALNSLTRQLTHRRVGEEAIEIEDRFGFSTPESFEVAIIALGDWKILSDGRIDLSQGDQRLVARIEASAPFEVIAEKIDEEGLAFTRLAVRVVGKNRDGWIRQRFTPSGS